jgi:hypothetical protein
MSSVIYLINFSSPWLAVLWLLLGAWQIRQAVITRSAFELFVGAAALLTAALVIFVGGSMHWWVWQAGAFSALYVSGLLVVGLDFLLDGLLFRPRGQPGVIRRPFGPFERMLALRYLGTKREHGGLAFISFVSVIGITLGVWALILTMSIMNGFRLELISKIIGFEPHAIIDTRGMAQPETDALI